MLGLSARRLFSPAQRQAAPPDARPLAPPCPPLPGSRRPQGVSEEVGLIKWPSPLKAVVQTLLVIAIVGGTSALLLAINGALSELSKLY